MSQGPQDGHQVISNIPLNLEMIGAGLGLHL